jgi:hypothetical protein
MMLSSKKGHANHDVAIHFVALFFHPHQKGVFESHVPQKPFTI